MNEYFHDLQKAQAVINSCTKLQHLAAAVKYRVLFEKKHGQSFKLKESLMKKRLELLIQ